MNLFQKLYSNISGVSVILIAVVISLFSHQDYGISSDESLQRELGKNVYNYVFYGDNTYEIMLDNDYGVAFEAPLYILTEKILGFTDTKDIFEHRHLFSHWLFLVGVFFFFLLIKRLFKSDLLALIGILGFLLNPRIYAHSFFNSKDLPLLSFILIGLYFLFRVIENRRVLHVICLALISAVIVNNRIVGGVFVASTLFAFLIQFLKDNKGRKSVVKNGVVYGLIFSLFLYVTWPILWHNPIKELASIFNNMAHFRWEENVLFLGDIINATNLPWYYLPVWIGTTTPLLILILSIAGALYLLFNLIKTINKKELNELGVFSMSIVSFIVLPFCMVIVLGSVLYDGWRHFYFIYPAIIFFMVYLLSALHKNQVILYSAVIVLLFFDSGVFMLQNHPYQQVYFNGLLSKNNNDIRHTMEADYWGTSYKQALLFIAENDKREKITIAFETGICKDNIKMLPKEFRSKFSFTKQTDSANYFVTNYRWHMMKTQSFSESLKFEPVYEVKVQNSSIMSAWKLR